MTPSALLREPVETLGVVRSEPIPQVGSVRLHAFDRLRVFTALAVFLFHVGHIFDLDPSGSIKNAETSMPASLYSALGILWHMPLFFMLAGAATFVAMKRRSSAKELVRERSARLLRPLLFGTLFLVPWNAFLSARNHRTFAGSFWRWLPVHAERTWDSLKLTEHQGLISFYWTSWHLWFLGYLFVFTVIALPIFRWGQSAQGQHLVARLAGSGLAPYAVLFVLLRVGVGAVGAPHSCGATTFGYFLYFILGWLLMTDPRLLEAARRQGPTWLGVGLGCFAVLTACIPSGHLARWLLAGTPSLDYAIGEGLLGLQACAWTFGFIGCALRWASSASVSPLMKYATQATLPFYILHQVLVFTVGAVVVEWTASLGAKMLLITVLSFAGTIAIHELVVRRSRSVRWLFGMRA